MRARSKKLLKNVLAVFLLLCLLLSFPQVSNGVAGSIGSALNWPKEKIEQVGEFVKDIARVALGVGIGVALIMAGAAASIALIGVALVVVGLAVIAYSVWGIFSPNKTEKPDDVNINQYEG